MSNHEERYLLEALQTLHAEYAKAAKPYIDRLAAIRSMRIEPIYIPLEALSEEFKEAMNASLKK